MKRFAITTSDWVSITALIMTFLFGIWGIQLGIASLRLSENVANQQQQIRGFDTLLNKLNWTFFNEA